MDYFRERNGKHYSNGPSSNAGRAWLARIALMIVPLLALGGLYLGAYGKGAELPPVPVVAGVAVIFLGFNVLSFFLRRAGYGAGVVVDQMKGSIVYRRPGGQRHTVQRERVRELLLVRKGGSGSPSSGGVFVILFLITDDGNKHPVSHGRDYTAMRRFADEMAILTSSTVREETG